MQNKSPLLRKKAEGLLPFFALLLSVLLVFSIFYNFAWLGADDGEIVKDQLRSSFGDQLLAQLTQLRSGQFRSILGSVFATLCGLLQYAFIDTAAGLLWFRVCSLLAILATVYVAARFVQSLLGGKAALLYSILSLVFIQVYDTHDSAFLDMGISYQLKMVFVIACLAEFVSFFRDRNKKHLSRSAVWYFISCSLYEAFAVLCVPVFILALDHLHREGRLSLKALFAALYRHIIAGVAYLISYFVPHLLIGKNMEYGGVAVSQSHTLAQRAQAWFRITFQNFPLRLSFLDTERYSVWSAFVAQMKEEPLLWGFRIACVAVAAAAVYYLMRKLPQIEKKSLLRIGLYSLLCAFSFTFLISQTSQYIMMATSKTDANQNIASSFFPYFPIIAIFLCLFLLFRHLPKKYERAISALASLLFFAAGVLTWTSNAHYRDSYLRKYYAPDEIFRSEAFEQVQDGDTLLFYQPYADYNDFEKTEKRIFDTLGKQVSLRQFSYSTDAFFISDVWYLKFNRVSGIAVFTHIDADFTENEVWVYFPTYTGTEKLYLDYGDNYENTLSLPLYACDDPRVASIELTQTANGSTLVHLTTTEEYDFRNTHKDFT